MYKSKLNTQTLGVKFIDNFKKIETHICIIQNIN